MKYYRNIFTVLLAMMLVFSQLAFVSAETPKPVVEEGTESLQQILETTTNKLWDSVKSRPTLNHDLLLAYMQTGLVPKEEIAGKIPESSSNDTLITVTNTAAALAAVQSNPYAYNGKNYGGILSSSQVGEGYFSLGSDNDKNAKGFIEALFALELMGADYNRETALAYLLSDNVLETVDGVTSVKGDTNGLLSGLAISVLIGYQEENKVVAEKIIDLLDYVKNRERHFAAALGLYVDNLYALGENPYDAKWNIMYNNEELPIEDAYRQLIIATGIKNGLHVTSKESTSSWSLLGLTALAKEKSMIQQAKQQFADLEFDFSPKTIEVTNVKHQFLAQDVPFKPEFTVKDQYGTPVKAKVNLQSSNPSILTINEKNELVGKIAGEAVITASPEGYPDVRTVFSFIVSEDAGTIEISEKIGYAIDYINKQDKLSSFHDAVALRTFGYPKHKLEQIINVYVASNNNPYNEARNILSILAAGKDPENYNGTNRVALMREGLGTKDNLSAEDAAHIIIAQYVIGEKPDGKAIDFLLKGITEKDGKMFVEYNNSPYILDTAYVLWALALINEDDLVTENKEQLKEAEAKVFTFFKSNYQDGQFTSEKERNAVAVLNYLGIKQETDYEGFNALELANVILAAQVKNTAFTNGSIPGLSGLPFESTGIALNAVSTVFTNKNAYLQLKEKVEQKATTIVFDLPGKAKINEEFTLKAELLDQNGQKMDAPITWTIDGKSVVSSFTPTEPGIIIIRAEAAGVNAEKSIEVIDYQKVFSFVIEPIENVLTDTDVFLKATITDSEGEIVTDEPITWGVEPSTGAVINGSIVRFSTPGQYTITASAGGVSARAFELTVDLNPDSIYTQVVQATEKMKQYLENRGQYDYISALAYRNAVNDPEKSQKQMRSVGHLREYGNHDNKYALYYAKNIFLAVAANEDPKTFNTYKGPVVDLVTPLVNSQDADGHFTMFEAFDKESVTTQALSIIALDLIEETYDKEKAVKDLLRGLNGPISEGSYKETELRALSLIAFSKHRDIGGVEKQIENNLNYIKSKQNDDGGFDYGGYSNSPFAIGTIIQGLIAVGENPYEAKWKKNGTTMIEVLLRQQIENGGFKFGDGFDGEFSFDELKATEGGFGALADLYTKTSMYNEAGIILDPIPGQNDRDVKPFIEISELDLKQDQPLLTVKVTAFDNIDGELTPTVEVNGSPVYSVSDTYKAIVANGENILTVTTKNSIGNESVERIPLLYQNTAANSVPQVTVNVVGVEGINMYSQPVIIEDGDTAYSVLVKAIGKNNILSKPYKDGIYIVGINDLKELDHGEDSGWMYRVNGVFPSVYSGEIELHDNDQLDWMYTTNLGKDIGAYFPPSSGGGGGLSPDPTPETEEIIVTPNQPFVLDEKLQGNVSTPVILNFGEGSTELPQVTAPRGDSVLEIPQGTKVTSAWDGKLQVPTRQNTNQSDLEAINKVLGETGKEIEKVDLHIKVGGDQTIQFDQHVTLTFKGKAGLTPGFIGTDGQFELILIGTDSTADVYYYVRGNDLIVKTNHFTEFLLFNATDKTIDFSDIKGHWAEEFIREAAHLGIIKGHVDGTFKPNTHLTRAQAVSILVRALDLQTDEAAPFKDIKGYAAETQAEIAAAYKYGLVIGQDGNFMPSNKVTRSQMALMLHRAYKQKTGVKYVAKEKAPYSDFGKADEETVNAISMLYEMGIATGSNGKYMPANPTQRAHAAKMLVNFFEQLQ